uniref:Uncharacterized protein n=1 Tax=Caenorhabditis japonica TaxID=281687 RepID=A0A8R1IPH2_CAEJA
MARSKLSMEGSVRNRFNRKKKGFFNNHNNNHATFQNGHLETGHFETAPTGEVKSGIVNSCKKAHNRSEIENFVVCLLY